VLFAGRHWVIDPLDGGKNFIRGVPVWATLIALMVDGVPTVAVVSGVAVGRTCAGRATCPNDGWRSHPRYVVALAPLARNVGLVGWIVDGMNVIGPRPDGWWRDRRRAMVGLVDRLERWASAEGDDVTVVFERPPSPPIRSSVIDIAHAPKAGANSADDEIVRLVRGHARPQEIRVVTSDSTLRDRVREAPTLTATAGPSATARVPRHGTVIDPRISCRPTFMAARSNRAHPPYGDPYAQSCSPPTTPESRGGIHRGPSSVRRPHDAGS
jgi:hypothetical protein